MNHLTALAERLAKLAQEHPDGIPTEFIDIERRRVIELAHMMDEGLL